MSLNAEQHHGCQCNPELGFFSGDILTFLMVFKAIAEEENLEKMKAESRGLPKLRLDMLRQLKVALSEGFSRHDKTGNRFVSSIDHSIRSYIDHWIRSVISDHF